MSQKSTDEFTLIRAQVTPQVPNGNVVYYLQFTDAWNQPKWVLFVLDPKDALEMGEKLAEAAREAFMGGQ